MASIKWTRAVKAGLAGTSAMTILTFMAPKMGLPPMDIGAMLGSVMGGSLALGWMTHFIIGTVLALGYAALFASRLGGPGVARGAIYALLPWATAQLVVMPMMGAGLFGGSFGAAFGSLMGHVVYGAVLGGLYGVEAGRELAGAHAHP